MSNHVKKANETTQKINGGRMRELTPEKSTHIIIIIIILHVMGNLNRPGTRELLALLAKHKGNIDN